MRCTRCAHVCREAHVAHQDFASVNSTTDRDPGPVPRVIFNPVQSSESTATFQNSASTLASHLWGSHVVSACSPLWKVPPSQPLIDPSHSSQHLCLETIHFALECSGRRPAAKDFTDKHDAEPTSPLEWTWPNIPAIEKLEKMSKISWSQPT